MRVRATLVLLIGLLAWNTATMATLPPPDSAKSKDVPALNTATVPASRDNEPAWKARHEAMNQGARKGDANLIFIGDSITEGWEGEGKEVWAKNYAAHKALNLGIGGDRTQHVLWRLQNGNIDGIKPKAAVVMIGTNNIGGNNNTAEETAEGITAIIKQLQSKLPDTKILLLAVFPREEKPGPMRETITKINQIISKLDDGKKVFYLDITKKFTDAEGTISKEIMPDFLHLSKKGYEIWADSIKTKLDGLMKTETTERK